MVVKSGQSSCSGVLKVSHRIKARATSVIFDTRFRSGTTLCCLINISDVGSHSIRGLWLYPVRYMMYFSLVVVDAAAANAQARQSHSQLLVAMFPDSLKGQDLRSSSEEH